jgi:hypothetical protein
MGFQSPLWGCASGLSNSGHVCVSCFKIEMDLILFFFFLPQQSTDHKKWLLWVVESF